jgi:hypothetical protein
MEFNSTLGIAYFIGIAKVHPSSDLFAYVTAVYDALPRYDPVNEARLIDLVFAFLNGS